MKESLQNIGDLIAEPSAAFSRLKLQPRSGIAFIVFYLFSVLIGWAVLPYTKVLSAAQLVKRGLQPEQLESAGNIGQIFESIGIFIGPIFAIVMFVIISAVLKLAARFLVEGDTLEFRHIYAAVVHISLIGCIIQLANAALLLVFKDIEGIKSAADLKMIPGLHLLFFLSYVDILGIWSIFVLTVAVSTLAEINKTKACLTAVIIWLLRIGVDTLFQVGSSS